MIVKLKPINKDMVIHCKNEDEKKLLWMWFFENGYVRRNEYTDSLENFLNCFVYSINDEEKCWDTPDGKRTTHEFSELQINKVLYLCDEKECETCHHECRHTTDINHAKNFRENIGCMVEKEPDRDKKKEIEILSALNKLFKENLSQELEAICSRLEKLIRIKYGIYDGKLEEMEGE